MLRCKYTVTNIQSFHLIQFHCSSAPEREKTSERMCPLSLKKAISRSRKWRRRQCCRRLSRCTLVIVMYALCHARAALSLFFALYHLHSRSQSQAEGGGAEEEEEGGFPGMGIRIGSGPSGVERCSVMMMRFTRKILRGNG